MDNPENKKCLFGKDGNKKSLQQQKNITRWITQKMRNASS